MARFNIPNKIGPDNLADIGHQITRNDPAKTTRSTINKARVGTSSLFGFSEALLRGSAYQTPFKVLEKLGAQLTGAFVGVWDMFKEDMEKDVAGTFVPKEVAVAAEGLNAFNGLTGSVEAGLGASGSVTIDPTIDNPTSSAVIQIAKNEIGTSETHPGLNDNKYGKWFGRDGIPWSAIFVSWCFNRAGFPFEENQTSLTHFAIPQEAYNVYLAAGRVKIGNKSQPEVGDLVFFNMSGYDQGVAPVDQIGIVTEVSAKSIKMIVGDSAEGGSVNGGTVRELSFGGSTSGQGTVFGYGIPPYGGGGRTTIPGPDGVFGTEDDVSILITTGTGTFKGGVSDGTTLGNYVSIYGPMAFTVGNSNGIPYVAIIAQSAHESGWGDSRLTREAFNFFGIKAGSSWDGPTITLNTQEEVNGNMVTVSAQFRKYANAEAGFQGYADFIKNNSRYAAALNFPNDPYGYIQAIKDAGYATDSSYVRKVHDTIDDVLRYIEDNDLVTVGGGSGTGIAGNLQFPPGLGGEHATRAGYYQMPVPNENSPYAFAVPSARSQHWSHKTTLAVHYTVASAYAAQFPGAKLRIGDLNASGHKTHNDGQAADITGFMNGQVDSATKMDAGGYHSGGQERTIALGKLYLSTGLIRNIFYNDPTVTDAMKEYAEQNNLPYNSIKAVSGHRDHFHVDVQVDPLENWTPS